jgi:hypothetical protein
MARAESKPTTLLPVRFASSLETIPSTLGIGDRYWFN